MRLVQKLTLAFVLTTSTVIAVSGAVRAEREVRALEFDRVRDHRIMGRAIGAALAGIWRTDGEAHALAILDQANVADAHVHMRWVWLEGGAGDVHTAFDPAIVEATPVGDAITRVVPAAPAAPEGMRYTYVPLAVDRSRRGALELSESLAGQRRLTERVVLETLALTLILALVSAGLAALLGIWIVGRPVRALAGKARRVGQGDFTVPLHLRQKDELGELAREMNTMCERLVALHERVEQETAKKLAAVEQLRHADRLGTVGKLASGIAHELGTPLNVVHARAHMIADGEATAAETRDYASVIIEASDRMTRIIRQLLDFARKRPAPPAAERVACALVPLARRTLDLLAPLAGKHGVEVALETGDGREVIVPADVGALEQVVTNLVVNAVQAMAGIKQRGTVRVRVREELCARPDAAGQAEVACASVSVIDEGPGIPEGDLPHVFEPFFTTKDVGDGTGLGLSVAYGIVQDHGGWIAVVSAEGKGSTFRVYLPLPIGSHPAPALRGRGAGGEGF